MTKTEYIENIVKKLKTRRAKNIIYAIIIFLVAFAFGYRFYRVAMENNFEVFNIIRNNMENGTVVDVVVAENKNGILYEPLTIKNNYAYVSGARVNNFQSGQKIGNCKIVSVSKNIDLDTGMHVIKTSKCSDGLQYVEKNKNGFYIPSSAVHGNNIFVSDNGVARVREIQILDRDAQNVLVKSGVSNGEIIILSDVKNGEKIKIAK